MKTSTLICVFILLCTPVLAAAPVIYEPQPAGTLPTGTKSIIIHAKTDVNARCHWSADPNANFATNWWGYAYMGTGYYHTAKVTALSDGNTYTYYIGCRNEADQALSTATITFRVATAAENVQTIASHNFDDGTLGPYIGNPIGDINVIADPTGAGKGKVVRIHYVGSYGDRNINFALNWPDGIKLGETLYFSGEVYLPNGINTDPFVGRKLLYYQSDNWPYQPYFASVPGVFGLGLYVDNVYMTAAGEGIHQMGPTTPTNLTTGRWHKFEMQLTLNSRLDTRDGINRIWIDNVLVHEKTDLTWTDAALTVDPATIKFTGFYVGDQVNYNQGSFDEYRYWDNVVFSRTRTGTTTPPPPADTTAPTVSGGAPTGTLAAGTTSTTLRVTTNENANCRYSSTANTAYSSMTAMSSTGSTSHSSTLSGLSNGQTYTIYVKCQDTAGNTNTADYTVSFSVANTQQPTAGIAADSTYAGYSASAIDDNIVSQSNSWASEETSSPHWVTITFNQPTTIGSATLHWGYNNFQNNYMTSQKVEVQTWDGSQYITRAIHTSGAAVPTSTVTFTPVTTTSIRLYQPANMGHTNYNTVLWLGEVDYSASTTTPTLVGDVNGDGIVNLADLQLVQADLGKTSGYNPASDVKKDGIINVHDLVLVGQNWGKTSTTTPPPPADTTPPVISGGQPTGQLAAGTTSTTLRVTTNENANCRYSSTANTAYSSMTAMSSTGSTSHSSTLSGLSNGQTYTRYIKCSDATGNTNTADYTVTFSIASSTSGTTILASHNFEDGTFGPYVNPWGMDIDVVSDPTNSGKGKVARIHYAGSNQDRNRALAVEHKLSFGGTMYFKGDFYVATNAGISPSDGFYHRKLLYWQRKEMTKYTDAGPLLWGILGIVGNTLEWDGGYVRADGADIHIMGRSLATLEGNRWYTIEVQTTMNSAPDKTDGIVRIWLDGQLLYEKTDMTWTDPNWANKNWGTPLDWNDVGLYGWLYGEQVNYHGTFDEYRYWDNAVFSQTRVQ